MRLEGKVALITGGGSGIGAAAARHMAAAGAKIAVCGIPAAGVNEVAASRRADGFAERPNPKRDSVLDAEEFACASAGVTQDSRRMSFIDEQHGVMGFGQVAQRVQRGDSAIHAEQAVGNDQSSS